MKIIYSLIVLVLCSHVSFGQDTANSSANQATDYRELIYIHTDKPYYLAGETIHLKVYNLEHSTSRPSRLSKVAYVELLDEQNTRQVTAKIELQDGSGYGDMYVPTNINSGHMILRAYTRWMRNAGPESFSTNWCLSSIPSGAWGSNQSQWPRKTSCGFSPKGAPMFMGKKPIW
ncbi:MAG: hypothetical protein HC819_22145 [Cyclobacteriaceae bacterium]|nr:hypothetical protein [Cyclobacteriaceae bacterium]